MFNEIMMIKTKLKKCHVHKTYFKLCSAVLLITINLVAISLGNLATVHATNDWTGKERPREEPYRNTLWDVVVGYSCVKISKPNWTSGSYSGVYVGDDFKSCWADKNWESDFKTTSYAIKKRYGNIFKGQRYRDAENKCRQKVGYIWLSNDVTHSTSCVRSDKLRNKSSEAVLRKKCTRQGRLWSTGDPLIPGDSYCTKNCAKKDYKYDNSSQECVKRINPEMPNPSREYCKNTLHRGFTGSKTKGHCLKKGEADIKKVCPDKKYPYYVVASPYDKCSKDNPEETDPETEAGETGGKKDGKKGGKNQPPTNPNNKARQNCENKLHRVWVGTKNGKGKCSTKCQEGFKHPKDKPHACVAKKDKKDSKKPTVKLTQPAQKSTADKTIKLAAKAKDNVAVSKVVFYSNVSKDGSKVLADGKFKQVAEDTSKPYTTDLNTEKLADKTKLKVYAVAVDSNGNKAKSSVAKVTVMHGTGPVDPGEGDCSKNLKQSFDVALPAQLSAKKISNNKGIAVQSTCDAAGQSVDYVLKLTGINMTLQAADLEAYRQTADGKYTLSEDITIEDVDATDGTDKSYVEVSYSATDGDAYDLNSASAAILNHIFLNKVDDGDEPKKPDDDKKPDTGTGTGTTTGTTPGTQTPGTICTDNTDGSATCTDANGNTYSLGAKGKGAGVLPNTGTSALLGIFAVAAAGVGAVVYKIVKKRGASPATNPYDQM